MCDMVCVTKWCMCVPCEGGVWWCVYVCVPCEGGVWWCVYVCSSWYSRSTSRKYRPMNIIPCLYMINEKAGYAFNLQ